MLVIGSMAASRRIYNFRRPNDIDVWMSRKDFYRFYAINKDKLDYLGPSKTKNKYLALIKNDRIEIGLYSENSPEYMIEEAQKGLGRNIYINLHGCEFIVPSIYALKEIKRSHIIFPIKWQKHIRDYHALKQAYETPGRPRHDNKELIDRACKLLREEARERFKARRPNLNMSNEDFFARSQNIIGRKYNHDDIHKATCYYNDPLYTKIKKDQSLAMCDEDLWNKLPMKDKIKAVQEEAFVIALERYLIPKYTNLHQISADEELHAYEKALCKICTTLTSGWFREFAIENWPACMINYQGFSLRFAKAVNEGRVRDYEEV